MMKPVILSVSFLALVASAGASSLAEAHRGDFLVGVALGGTVPKDYSTAERKLLEREFNQLTPENCMKPESVQPQEGKWTFEMADALVDYAKKRGVPVYGHTLVWHQQTPDWFFRDGNKQASKKVALNRLKAHIAKVAGRYKGKVAGWDVVNEAISDNPSEYLRPTKWLEIVGEDYIAEAFKAAAKADPKAELQYNDYGIESPAKREKTIKLLKKLIQAKVPIHSVGIQGHWTRDYLPLKDIEDSIIAYSELGLKVAITELDIDMLPRDFGGADLDQQGNGPSSTEAKPLSAADAKKQAELYGQLFDLFRKHRKKISRVTFWGLHDGRSWLNTWPNERYNHPLVFDRDSLPKPAYNAILKAFAKPGSAPTKLSGVVAAPKAVQLSWAATSGATTYILERSTNSKFTSSLKRVDIGKVTSYTDTSVKGGKTYYYRVLAITPGGVTAASKSLKVTTPKSKAKGTTVLTRTSARGQCGTGSATLQLGFVIEGKAPRKVLIRGLGPALATEGVSGVLANPQISVYRGSTLIAYNDNWTTNGNLSALKKAQKSLKVKPQLTKSSKDAALLLELLPGTYVVTAKAKSGKGTALIDVSLLP
ncbi:MAG: endo-1,4-beta-xylanase [Opitutus sp.]|nr:endo-1,4-beta-xylanase [Opitutus sp.]